MPDDTSRVGFMPVFLAKPTSPAKASSRVCHLQPALPTSTSAHRHRSRRALTDFLPRSRAVKDDSAM